MKRITQAFHVHAFLFGWFLYLVLSEGKPHFLCKQHSFARRADEALVEAATHGYLDVVEKLVVSRALSNHGMK